MNQTPLPDPQSDFDGDAIIYVRTPLKKEDLAELVAIALGGTVESTAWGVTGVSRDGWDVALSSNPITGEPDDDFVHWPWQIEFTPTGDATDPRQTLQDVRTLVESLWSQRHWAVVSADYEHLLPHSGGWHAGQYLGQPGAGADS